MANSIIPNQSYFSDFRQRCEDKNTLQNKGDLYIGTGNKITTNIDAEAPVDIYQTDVLSAPAKANQVIISKGKVGTEQQGIEYKDIISAVNDAIEKGGIKISQSAVSDVSDAVKISGYPSVSDIKIQVVSQLPSSVDASTLYIIF